MRTLVRTTVMVGALAAGAAACDRPPLPTAKEGRTLYAENGCASCHGPGGRGDGAVARTLDPRPRDFQDVAAFKRGFDVDAIARTLATGILLPAAPATGATGAPSHHQQGMPKFDHLSEVERQSLALYVISLHDPARQGARQP
jgi:mono/diheme cytochrome c family protein